MPAVVLEIATSRSSRRTPTGFADAVREEIKYVPDTPGFRGPVPHWADRLRTR
jgi:hypothetical protein